MSPPTPLTSLALPGLRSRVESLYQVLSDSALQYQRWISANGEGQNPRDLILKAALALLRDLTPTRSRAGIDYIDNIDCPDITEGNLSLSQKAVLSELREKLLCGAGLSAAFPGDPHSYLSFVSEMLNHPSRKDQFLLFLEGVLQKLGNAPPPQNEDKVATDPFADLLRMARDMGGHERRFIEALCYAHGEMPLVDVKELCGWQLPIESAWNSLRMRVNKKLKTLDWKVKTKGKNARLTKLAP